MPLSGKLRSLSADMPGLSRSEPRTCPEVKIDLEMEPLSTKTLDETNSKTRDASTADLAAPEGKVSGVINLLVRQARAETFEQWLQEIYSAVSTFPGFIYRVVRQPVSTSQS